MDVEDLEVYKKLCGLHMEVCDLTQKWPKEEKYELRGQNRRSFKQQREPRWQLAEESAVYGVNDETLSGLAPDT
jgi:hypothetical protein